MSKETTEKIYLQDELPIVLITTMELKTFIKWYHVYKDTWIPTEGEQFEVFMEPDNPKDKFAVCVKAWISEEMDVDEEFQVTKVGH